MRLRLLFVDYSDKHETLMPNAMAVCDEYLEDAHGGIPDFWREEQARIGDYPTREAFIMIPDEWVEGLFEPPAIAGEPVAKTEAAP